MQRSGEGASVTDAERAQLDQIYRRSQGGSVAFLDETYELDHGSTFYIMTAIVVRKHVLADLRKELTSQIPGNYWHTTESLTTSDGRRRAQHLSDWLGNHRGGQVCIVAQHHQVHGDGEQARAECLRGLATVLQRGDRLLAEPVRLLVMERRKYRQQQHSDDAVIKDLRAKTNDRHLGFIQATPAAEPLLWLPDLAAMALRRRITHRDNTLWKPMEPIARTINPVAADVPAPHETLPPLLPAAGAPIRRPVHTAAAAAAFAQRRAAQAVPCTPQVPSDGDRRPIPPKQQRTDYDKGR